MLSVLAANSTPTRITDVFGHQFINAQLIADQLAANGYFVVMVFPPSLDIRAKL